MNLEIGQEIWYVDYNNKIFSGKIIALKNDGSTFKKQYCCIETETELKLFEVNVERVFTSKWAVLIACATKLQKDASDKLTEAAALFAQAEIQPVKRGE